jgi:hypothetical protein
MARSRSLNNFIPFDRTCHGYFNTGWLSLLKRRGTNNGIDQYEIRLQEGLAEFIKEIKDECVDKSEFTKMISELKCPLAIREPVIEKWKTILRNIQDVSEIHMLSQYITSHPPIDLVVILCGARHYTNLKSLIAGSPLFEIYKELSSDMDYFASELMKHHVRRMSPVSTRPAAGGAGGGPPPRKSRRSRLRYRSLRPRKQTRRRT